MYRKCAGASCCVTGLGFVYVCWYSSLCCQDLSPVYVRFRLNFRMILELWGADLCLIQCLLLSFLVSHQGRTEVHCLALPCLSFSSLPFFVVFHQGKN